MGQLRSSSCAVHHHMGLFTAFILLSREVYSSRAACLDAARSWACLLSFASLTFSCKRHHSLSQSTQGLSAAAPRAITKSAETGTPGLTCCSSRYCCLGTLSLLLKSCFLTMAMILSNSAGSICISTGDYEQTCLLHRIPFISMMEQAALLAVPH